MAEELAVAYVSLVPSAKGIGAQIAKELAPAEVAAAATGQRAGKNLSSSLLGALPGGAKLAGALGLAAIGAAAFSAAKDVEGAYNTIRVGTGATGKALDGLEASFRKVAANSPASFDDVSTAIANLNTRTGTTGATLEGLATQFIRLSRLTKTDLRQDITDLTRVFGDWSIKTADQGTALDKMFRATQVTGVGLNELAQNVVQFGAPLRNLGFTFDQSIALFSKFEKEGVNIQTVLAGLRFGLKTFAKAGEEPIDALQRVEDQIKSAGTSAEANSIAFQVFGVRAGPDMAAAIREGRLELSDLIAQISGGKDTIGSAAQDTATLGSRLAILGNKAKLALGEFALPVLEGATAALGDMIPVATTLGEVISFLGPAIKPAVLGFTAFYATSKLLVPAMGLLNTGVQKLGQGLLNQGFAANGPAVQGLASVANAGQRLQAALPLAAAGLAGLAVGFSQAGEAGTQGSIGIAEMAAGGALLGTSVLPGVGTAVGLVGGALAGLAVNMAGGGESAEAYAKRIGGISSALDALGNKAAGKQAADLLEKYVGIFGKTDGLKAFQHDLQGIAADSPAAANKAVDALRAMRDEAGNPLIPDSVAQQFYATIDQQIVKTKQAAQHKRDADAANQQYLGSEQNLGAGVDDTTQSLNDQITALQNLQSVTLGQANAQVGYLQAVAGVDKAQQSLNDAIAQYGPDSAEARAAGLDLTSANNQLAGATLTLDQATAQLDATYTGHLDTLDADIQRLRDQQAQYPASAAALQPLIDKLEAERAKLAEIPSNVNTTVTADTSQAVQAINDFLAFLPTDVPGLASIAAIMRANQATLEGRASGGAVGPGSYLVGERGNGAELLTLAPGSRGYVTNAVATSTLLSTAAPAPGRGGPLLVVEGNVYGDTHLRSVFDEMLAEAQRILDSHERKSWS